VLKDPKKEGSGVLVVKVSASQQKDQGFEPYSGYDHVSSEVPVSARKQTRKGLI
jgi:hypothetical protein